jgi:hypothetical protein
MSFFAEDDIFEYILNHIHIYQYDKLKQVSTKFNRQFNINRKEFSDVVNAINSIGCDMRFLMKFMEERIIHKYRLCNIEAIKYTSLYHYMHCDHTHKLSKSYKRCFNQAIITKNMIYMESLIGLIYCSEYSKRRHKVVIAIFDNMSKHIVSKPINNETSKNFIFNLIIVCCDILNVIKTDLRKSIRYKKYNINICLYVSILAKALHIYLDSNNCKGIWLSANENLDNYKDTLTTKDNYAKIFPPYYLKYVIDMIDKLYITV